MTTPRTAAETVQSYFAAVIRADHQALEHLFTEDAVIDFGTTEVHGNKAVGEFYRGVFAKDTPKPKPRPLIVDGNHVSVEIDLHYEGTDVFVADFFTVVDGRIQRLRVYQG